MKGHQFDSYLLDPVPEKLWRKGNPVPGTKLGFCNTCGFYHVDPYFSSDYLSKYYATYEMPTHQANLPETARFLARSIKDKTVSILDLGCGDGGFLNEMSKLGYGSLKGVDHSPGIERARKLGIGNFENKSLWDYLSELENDKKATPPIVSMINVLEHVTDPLPLLERIHRLMPAGGILLNVVPNDFSRLQQAFLKVKGHLPWFVCMPDHLNYFNMETLKTSLEKSGFSCLEESATYPLELYLLQDLDYIAQPELGPIAHQRRVMFESNVKQAGMTETLDHLYRTLASGGFGRDIMVTARKR